METESFHNFSAFIGARKLGLGWLSGISVLETDKAVRTDWHRHLTTEMLMCLRGETSYEFRNSPSVTLCAGSYLIVPAGTEHRVSEAIDKPGKRIGLNLRHASDPDRRYAVFSSRDYALFRQHLEADALHVHVCPTEMRHALSKLEDLVGRPRPSSVEYGLMRILCCTVLYEAVLPPTPRATSRSAIMDEAVNWLKSHFSENVSIDRLVAFMGYSRARFFALFREHTGLSPNDYLQRLRIRRAMELLSRGTASVGKVALACGFSDKCYFSRVFKRQTGYTPIGYRSLRRSSS